MIIAGIDPGVSGAIAFIDSEDGALISVLDMPTVATRMADGRKRRRCDPVELLGLLKAHDPELVVIEDVNSFNQGRTSAFSFGHSAGVAQSAAEITGAAVMMVPPAKWKPRMSCPADKDGSRKLATEIAGSGSSWSLKREDGKAEAFLLATYANRILKGEIVAVDQDGLNSRGCSEGASVESFREHDGRK